jgi:cell division initiation protein
MRKDKIVTEILGEELVLTPSEVCEKRFRRKLLGGYDRREVEGFLERVADVLEDLINEIRALKLAQQDQKAQIEQYREMEASLRQALASSQRFADDTLAAARRESESILEEARLKRAQMELDAQRLPESLARDVQLLEQQRSRLRMELIAVLETHRKLLDTHLPEQAATTPASEEGVIYLGEAPPSQAPERQPEPRKPETAKAEAPAPPPRVPTTPTAEELLADELPEAVIFGDRDADEETPLLIPEEPEEDEETLQRFDSDPSR